MIARYIFATVTGLISLWLLAAGGFLFWDSLRERPRWRSTQLASDAAFGGVLLLLGLAVAGVAAWIAGW